MTSYNPPPYQLCLCLLSVPMAAGLREPSALQYLSAAPPPPKVKICTSNSFVTLGTPRSQQIISTMAPTTRSKHAHSFVHQSHQVKPRLYSEMPSEENSFQPDLGVPQSNDIAPTMRSKRTNVSVDEPRRVKPRFHSKTPSPENSFQPDLGVSPSNDIHSLTTSSPGTSRSLSKKKKEWWSPEDKIPWLKLCKKGATLDELSEAFPDRKTQSLKDSYQYFKPKQFKAGKAAPHGGAAWTNLDIEILRSLRRRGESLKDASKNFPHRSYAAVAQISSKLNRSQLPPILCVSPPDPSEVAHFLVHSKWTNQMKITLIVLRKYLDKPWDFIHKILPSEYCHAYLDLPDALNLLFWTHQDNTTLTQLVAENPSPCWGEIARKLGRTPSSCQMHWSDGVCDAELSKRRQSPMLEFPKRHLEATWTVSDQRDLVASRTLLEPESWESIASRLNRTTLACNNQYWKIRNMAGQFKPWETENSLGNGGCTLLSEVSDQFTCRKCGQRTRVSREDHELFCGAGTGTLDCIDCGKNFKQENFLIQHYAVIHQCDIRKEGVEARWAERNPHLLLPLDLNNGYGLRLTRRAIVSGDGADRDIQKLWIDYTHTPEKVGNVEAKAKLLSAYRADFYRLFKTTPLRFHAHVSDINPSSVFSLIQTILQNAPKKLWGQLLPKEHARLYQSEGSFAYTPGTYGSAYGPGAHTSPIVKFRDTASGKAYSDNELRCF